VKFFLSFILSLFSLLMIYITFLNYKKNFFSSIENYIWQSIWVISIFLCLRPKAIDVYIEKNFQINFFYVFTIFSIFSLLILTFYYYSKIKILEKKVDQIIQSESLKNFFKDKP
jgi:hypothetical protein